QSAINYATSTRPIALTVADLNGDAKADLIVANGGIDGASVLWGNGNGTLQPGIKYGAGQPYSTFATADFNLDGALDFVAASPTGAVTIMLGIAVRNQIPRAVFRDPHGAVQMLTFPSSALSYAGGIFASDPSAAED